MVDGSSIGDRAPARAPARSLLDRRADRAGHAGARNCSIEPMTDPLTGPPLRRSRRGDAKSELHLHLDGSLRVATALELARTRRVDAPRTWAGMSAALVAPMPCADQAELLRAFDLPIALLQDAEALERVAAELVETKAADGVRYLEIRWGPLAARRARAAARGRDRGRVRGRPERGGSRTGTVVRLDLHRASVA